MAWQKGRETLSLAYKAEWEYAARAGSQTPFWSGNEPPPPEAANPWGLKSVHSGASEWCFDWYGLYPAQDQVDPVGSRIGLSRVIRGGGLVRLTPHYARSQNRASYAPGFAMMKGTETVKQGTSQLHQKEPSLQGLIGVWYGRTNLTDPKTVDEITTLDLDWKFFQEPGQDRGDMWSARWEGFVYGPVDGSVTFHAASEHGMTVFIDGKSVVEWTGSEAKRSGTLPMKKGRSYPIQVTYIHDHGNKSYLNLQWSWAGHSILKSGSTLPRPTLHG